MSGSVPRAPLVLASASSERLRILRQAGVHPIVRPSRVDEDVEGVGWSDARGRSLHLATRKAIEVARSTDEGLILAADSVMVAHGRILDKASDPSEVAAWWASYAGHVLAITTGHCLVQARDGATVTEVAVGRVQVTVPSDAEIRAYAEFEAVRKAAGAFVLEGPSAPFVANVTGDSGAISGLSMAVVRRLLRRMGHDMSDLWSLPA